MKREGRQHGTVRTLCIIPSSPLGPNRPAQRKGGPPIGSPPTAGVFTRVSTKPTNHSKFTGKCGRPRCTDCHLHPSWKSKDKIKGARKLRSTDMDLGYGGLLAWRVMGKAQDGWRPDNYKLKLNMCSASGILDELASLEYDQEEYEDHTNSYYYNDDNNNNNTYGDLFSSTSMNLDCLDEYPFISSPIVRISREIINEDEDEDEDEDGSANKFVEMDVVEDDDDMGFYDVAIVWDPIDGDEGWSLIGEI